MKKYIIIVALLVIIITGAVALGLYLKNRSAPEGIDTADEVISNFDECVAAGNPVMESYPRQCSAFGQTFTEEIVASGISEQEAIDIAENSDCVIEGPLTGNNFYNEVTYTWWLDLDIEKEGCNPACVVGEETKTAEINWRCTGLIME